MIGKNDDKYIIIDKWEKILILPKKKHNYLDCEIYYKLKVFNTKISNKSFLNT